MSNKKRESAEELKAKLNALELELETIKTALIKSKVGDKYIGRYFGRKTAYIGYPDTEEYFYCTEVIDDEYGFFKFVYFNNEVITFSEKLSFPFSDMKEEISKEEFELAVNRVYEQLIYIYIMRRGTLKEKVEFLEMEYFNNNKRLKDQQKIIKITGLVAVLELIGILILLLW